MDVLDMDPALNGWAYCRRRKDNKEGYVPVSYLGAKPKANGPTKQNKATPVSATESPGPNSLSQRQNKRGFIPNEEDKKQQSFHSQTHGNRSGSNMQSLQSQQAQNHQNQNAGNSPFRGNQQNNGYPQNQNRGDTNNSNQQPTNNHNNNNGNNRGGGNNHGNHTIIHPQQGRGDGNGNGPQTMVRTRALKVSQLNEIDRKMMVCSFHRDFIPSPEDLHRYFG